MKENDGMGKTNLRKLLGFANSEIQAIIFHL